MLHTNLATRPFYNDRVVRLGAAAVALALVALTVFNASMLVSLTERGRSADARREQAERLAAEFRQKARAITAEVNAAEMDAVRNAAREANLLIERRVFSWTELFNRFEATLPPDVRITAVEPQVDREGRLLISASVVSRRSEALSEFMDRLEAEGGFRDVIPRQEDRLEDGTLRSIVQGYYEPSAWPQTEADAAGGAAAAEPTPPREASNATGEEP
jgi:hypothetical protein